MTRCPWAKRDLAILYHDQEWGVPLRGNDRRWFEFLSLEGAQAGLSWDTILAKREAYRSAFYQFDPQRVAQMSATEREELLQNSGLVRNRLKLESVVHNAHAFLQVQANFKSFDAYIWQFVEGRPIQNTWHSLDEVPASTPTSEAMSRELKRLGFRFVGPTICYALMQATGMVNDHLRTCPRHQACADLA
jgi:DNA-3-methyladenine glycosylase I